MTSRTLLGHIVSKNGIAVDPDKVKALSQFLGQIWWHNRMLRYLADLAIPLHVAVHQTPFQWTDKAYRALKVLLSQAPIVQPPDWSKEFHVFVDAFNIAISSSLMQLTEPKWYCSVY